MKESETIMTTINNTSITIDTTVPTLSIGQIQLSADRRSTKEAPLTDAQRIRRAVIPANHWGAISADLNGVANQSLTDILRGALQAIGSDYLRDCLTSDPMMRELPLSALTVQALLQWNAETSTSRGSITFTREQVEAWFKSSFTKGALEAKHAGNAKLPAMLSLLATRFATLAAKNHGLKEPSDCDKLIALIDPQELEGSSASLVTEIMGRLDHIKKQLASKAAEATVSMDDL
jgi:hypothetical protein